MNRRDFVTKTLQAAGITSVVVPQFIQKPEAEELLLLSVAYANREAFEHAKTAAAAIVEATGCNVLIIPDIMKLERISQASAARLIEHFVMVREKTEAESPLQTSRNSD